MELIRDLHNMRPKHRGCVATMGAFDGVHLGHQAVLSQLITKGKELGLPSTVVVFEPLPREYFSPQKAPPRLMSFHEKFIALKQLGIDRVLRIRFTPKFQEWEAEQFIRRVFVDGLKIRYIIVGDDLRFGRNREGGFDTLKNNGKKYGFEVIPTPTLILQDERVSSTRIRRALEASDFTLAEILLSRPYSIYGRVIIGQQLGRQMGAPTANVQLHRQRTALSGVYAVTVQVNNTRYQGVANVGNRPTIDDDLKANLEVHILDFNQDIYRQNIEVFFHQKIRDEKKFESIDQLQQQINRDIQTGRACFSSAV